MQIVINLIRNAKDILQVLTTQEKKITVVVDRSSESTIRIQVIDNGIGISHEVANNIFTFGFTTKPHGHGFGLHSSALLAKEMGGTLNAANNEISSGAVFTLELPYRRA
jgi:C4-dicarboxylate-specific signal transduction histidine kinase